MAVRDNFLKDTSIIVFSSLVLAGINFLFQVYVSRALGPVAYGMLGVVFAIFYLVSAAITTIVYSLTKFFAEYNARGDRPAIRELFRRSVKKFNLLGFLFFLVFFLGSGFWTHFFNFPGRNSMFWIGIFIWAVFFTPVVWAFLGGLQKFWPLAILQVSGALIKLVLSLILILWGFGLNGVIAALAASSFLPFLAGLCWAWPYFQEKPAPLDVREIYRYSASVFVTSLCLTVFMNIDLILVKHFFSAIEAGFYSAAGTLTKTIFFGSTALVTVLFPKVAEGRALENDTRHLLGKAGGFFLAGSSVLMSLFYFCPEFTSRLVFGPEYQLKYLLFPMGLAVFFFSLVYILASYLMAVSADRFYPVMLAAAGLEIGLIWWRHASLLTVINSITLIMAATSIILGLFIFRRDFQNAVQ